MTVNNPNNPIHTKAFVHFHERNNCYRKRVGFQWNKAGTHLVEKDFYFTDAGQDIHRATAMALATKDEWKQLVTNWPQISQALAPMYPGRDLSRPFWPEAQAEKQVEQMTATTGVTQDTLEAARDAFIKHMEAKGGRKGTRGRKGSTIAKVSEVITRDLAGLNIKLPVATLTLRVITDLVDGWYGGHLAERTALNYARTLKQFLNWLSDSPDFNYSTPKGLKDVFTLGTPRSDYYVPTDAEIVELLDKATGKRGELWIRLGLAGMYQSDISALAPDAIKGETIVWQRQKEEANNISIYTWIPEATRTLIAKYRSTDPKRLFLSEIGTPMEEFNGNGSRTHNITDDYLGITKKCEHLSDKLSFKSLRKHTANRLYQLNNNIKLSQMFLGQQIPGVAGSAYVREFYKPLTEALKQLDRGT